MNYREQIREKRTRRFRTIMDIGMGIFYTAIGGIIIYAKSFASIEIPAWVAWLLGGMMVVGGIARFYRGIRTVLSERKGDNAGTTE